jgi:type I restriction enzyme M protein
MAHPSTIRQDEINELVWQASETFRAGQPPGSHLNHVLVLLCLKFLADFAKEPDAIPRHSPLPWKLPPGDAFDRLGRETRNFGERIDRILQKIGPVSRPPDHPFFPSISFSDEHVLGEVHERDFRLKRLLEDLRDLRLDFRPSRIGAMDVIGGCHDHLLTRSMSIWGESVRLVLSPEVSSQVLDLAAIYRMKPADVPFLQRRIDELECELARLRLEMRKQIRELKRSS